MLKTRFILLLLVLASCSEATAPNPVVETMTIAPVETRADERLPQVAQLLNHTPATLLDLLGQPAFVRRDGNVQVFQFKNITCVLDAYFYREGTGEDFLANHVDVRTPAGGDMLEAACLKAFFVEGNYPETLLEPEVTAE